MAYRVIVLENASFQRREAEWGRGVFATKAEADAAAEEFTAASRRSEGEFWSQFGDSHTTEATDLAVTHEWRDGSARKLRKRA